MGLLDFKIKQYTKYKLGNLDDNCTSAEYDEYLQKEETLNKTVSNLLKHFNPIFKPDGFDFSIDVFEYLPLDDLDKAEIITFIDHILTLMGEETLVGNKFIYNLNKISVDNAVKSNNQISRNYEFMYIHNYHEDELTIRSSITEKKQKYRSIIRRNPLNAQSIIDLFTQEILELKNKNNAIDLSDIVDLCADIILQVLNYWVITIEGVEKYKKIVLCNFIYKFLLDFQSSINDEPVKVECNLEERIKIFVSFLDKRNVFGEYINILNELEKEEVDDNEFFGEIPEEYKLSKHSIVKSDDIMKVILDGGEIYQFKLKHNNTKEAIKIFEIYGGRVASPENSLDQKVYFRELYISSSKYKIKASTIIRKMLDDYRINGKPTYTKLSEYMFLREKISRGYFREASQLDLYHLKNQIQEQLYKTLISSILLYDYEKSLGHLNKIIETLIPLCFSELDNILETMNRNRIFEKSIPF